MSSDVEPVQSAATIREALEKFRAGVKSTRYNIFEGVEKLDAMQRDLKRHKHGISLALVEIERKSNIAESQAAQSTQMERTILDLRSERDGASKKLRVLEDSIPSRVGAAIRPIQEELANVQAALSEEKENRTLEKEQLRDLWPHDCTMPTPLLASKAKDEQEVDNGGETDVRNSNDWNAHYDDEGRLYYVNVYTGETSWNMPQRSEIRTSPENSLPVHSSAEMTGPGQFSDSDEDIRQQLYQMSAREQEIKDSLCQVRRDIVALSDRLLSELREDAANAEKDTNCDTDPIDAVGCHLVDHAMLAGYIGQDMLKRVEERNFSTDDNNILSCVAVFFSEEDSEENGEKLQCGNGEAIAFVDDCPTSGGPCEMFGCLVDQLLVPPNEESEESQCAEVGNRFQHVVDPSLVDRAGMLNSFDVHKHKPCSDKLEAGLTSCFGGSATDQTRTYEPYEPSMATLEAEHTRHNRHRHQLLLRASELRRFIFDDNVNTMKMWEDFIEDRNEHISTLGAEIDSKESESRETEASIDIFSIKTVKPQAPEAVPPLDLATMPVIDNGVSLEDSLDNVMSHDAFDDFRVRLSQNMNPTLDSAIVVSEAQERLLKDTVDETNARLRVLHNQASHRYSVEMLKYEKQLMQYEVDEIARKEDLCIAKETLRSLRLRLSFLRDVLEIFERNIFSDELTSEFTRKEKFEQDRELDESSRCEQNLESTRVMERVGQLKNGLVRAFAQRKNAFERPLQETSFLGRLEAEKHRVCAVKGVESQIGCIRDQLIEEGKNLAELHKIEIQTANDAISYLHAEKVIAEERKRLTSLPRALVATQVNFREQLNEVMASRLGNTLESAVKQNTPEEQQQEEQYTKQRISEEQQIHNARRNFIEATNNVRSAINAYATIRRWQQAIRRSISKSSVCIKKQPSPDPTSFQLKIEISNLQRLLQDTTSAFQREVSVRNDAITTLEDAAAMLRSRLKVMETRRQEETANLRHMAEQSLTALHGRFKRSGAEFSEGERLFRLKIRQLSESLSATEKSLSTKIEETAKTLRASDDMSRAMRLDLKNHRMNEISMRLRLEKLERRIKDNLTLKRYLFRERQRSQRCDLLVAIICNLEKWYASEISAKDKMLRNKDNERGTAVKAVQDKLVKQRTTLLNLGMDVDALFLFFARRIANLAGAGRKFNDRLRENGGTAIFAAFCKGPRSDLRSIALEVLARMCWNGSTDNRSMRWDIHQHWTTLCEQAKAQQEQQPREETESSIDGRIGIMTAANVRVVVRQRRQQTVVGRNSAESPNTDNQIQLGAEQAVADMMLRSCLDGNSDFASESLFALCAASFNEKTVATLGAVNGFISRVVALCRSKSGPIRSQASVLLSNLALGSRRNQDTIQAQQGVQLLLRLCQDNTPAVIQGSVSALANLSYANSNICEAISKACGVELMVELVKGEQIVNLLEEDQRDEIQASAAECIANITRWFGSNSCKREEDRRLEQLDAVMGTFVLMCASKNTVVQSYSGLVLGNLAMNSRCRHIIGMEGGVEALFILCGSDDSAVQEDALWALSNMAYLPANQDRISRYFEALVSLCNSSFASVQAKAICCVANSVHYHGMNRSKLMTQVKAGLIFDLLKGGDLFVQQSVLRIMVSLSFDDCFDEALGQSTILPLVKDCASRFPALQKLVGTILLNASMHSKLAPIIAQNEYIELLLQMQQNTECIDTVNMILEQLANLRTDTEVDIVRKEISFEGMLRLCKSEDTDVQKLAVEHVADAIDANEKNQAAFLDYNGVACMLDICEGSLDHYILTHALSVVKSMSRCNHEVKADLGLRSVKVLLNIISSTVDSMVLEAALAALICFLLENEANCRQVLRDGLDHLIAVIEVDQNAGGSYGSKNNSALARSALEIMEPYCFLSCSNCAHKQPAGKTCESCGHDIDFSVNCKRIDRENTSAFNTTSRRLRHVCQNNRNEPRQPLGIIKAGFIS